MDGKIKPLFGLFHGGSEFHDGSGNFRFVPFSKDINFQQESIPLMIMAAASLSIVLAIFTTYLCGRFQAFGAMRIATAGLVLSLVGIICLVYQFGNSGETKIIYALLTCSARSSSFCPQFFLGMAVEFFRIRRNQRNGWA